MIYNVGDKVIVIKPKHVPIQGEEIWWHKIMDEYVGKTLTIIEVHENHYICNTDRGWSWIEEWIEDPVVTLINEVTGIQNKMIPLQEDKPSSRSQHSTHAKRALLPNAEITDTSQ